MHCINEVCISAVISDPEMEVQKRSAIASHSEADNRYVKAQNEAVMFYHDVVSPLCRSFHW